ncbi:helix-turn-helix domain-containing protein [Xanthomonas citri pv. eucalyptorum]|nr:helix-turn-helix domain-containing protein [Xanthomonas axonopodis pv. eucalyptorum]
MRSVRCFRWNVIEGQSLRAIGRRLGRSASTLSREIGRQQSSQYSAHSRRQSAIGRAADAASVRVCLHRRRPPILSSSRV